MKTLDWTDAERFNAIKLIVESFRLAPVKQIVINIAIDDISRITSHSADFLNLNRNLLISDFPALKVMFETK